MPKILIAAYEDFRDCKIIAAALFLQLINGNRL
jgi:hypothetical protein